MRLVIIRSLHWGLINPLEYFGGVVNQNQVLGSPTELQLMSRQVYPSTDCRHGILSAGNNAMARA